MKGTVQKHWPCLSMDLYVLRAVTCTCTQSKSHPHVHKAFTCLCAKTVMSLYTGEWYLYVYMTVTSNAHTEVTCSCTQDSWVFMNKDTNVFHYARQLHLSAAEPIIRYLSRIKCLNQTIEEHSVKCLGEFGRWPLASIEWLLILLSNSSLAGEQPCTCSTPVGLLLVRHCHVDVMFPCHIISFSITRAVCIIM
jgi:hypothetical protein